MHARRTDTAAMRFATANGRSSTGSRAANGTRFELTVRADWVTEPLGC